MPAVFRACVIASALVITVGGCEQVHRDSLRYGANDRGREVYELNPHWVPKEQRVHPLAAMAAVAQEELKFYQGYKDIVTSKEVRRTASGSPNVDLVSEVIRMPGMDMIHEVPRSAEGQDRQQHYSLTPTPSLLSQAEIHWPPQMLAKIAADSTVTEVKTDGAKTTTVTDGLGKEMVRALSSTVSVSQMRDLMTEPGFPAMLPVSREVTLGCLPPPDSAAFEAAHKLAVQLPENNGALSTEYASKVAKLFEESERTLFLQYSLYRLCEMSVNAPAGFRNVYPIMVHDIVRRTAEMRELADVHFAQARVEEEKTRQEAERTAQKRADTQEATINLLIAQCADKRVADKARATKAELDSAGQECRAAYRPAVAAK